MDCSLPGSSVHGISQARNGLEWLPFPFPGDLPNPESNPGVLHYRQILYQLSYEGRPWEKEMGEIWVWGLHSVNSVVSYWSIFRKRSDLCLGNLTALATWEAGNRAQVYPLHSSVGWTIISLVAVKGVLWSCRTLKSLEGLPRWHEVEKNSSATRWSSGKESACQGRRHNSCNFDPWVRKIPWNRKWHPLQHSCLETSMDRGARQATVHGAAKSWTWILWRGPGRLLLSYSRRQQKPL